MHLVVVVPLPTAFRSVRLARERGLGALVVTGDPEQARARQATRHTDSE